MTNDHIFSRLLVMAIFLTIGGCSGGGAGSSGSAGAMGTGGSNGRAGSSGQSGASAGSGGATGGSAGAGGTPDGGAGTAGNTALDCDAVLTALNIQEWHFSEKTGGGPVGIAAGSDGEMWFTLGHADTKGNSIGNIAVDGTVTTTFPLPTPGVGINITSGPDGNLWVNEPSVSKIAKVTPLGVVTEVSVQGPGVSGRIVFDTSGTPWAIADYLGGTIVHMGTDGSNVTYIYLLSQYYPGTPNVPAYAQSMVAGLNNDVWVFSDSRGNGPGGQSGFQHITSDGIVTWYRIPELAVGSLNPGSGKDMVVGPDKNIWTLFDKEISKFTPGDKVVETYMSFPLSIPGLTRSGANGFTVGPDGNLWFSETKTGGYGLVSVTPAGAIKEVSWSDKCEFPSDIASGPDGNIWFSMAGFGVGKYQFGGIARLKLSP